MGGGGGGGGRSPCCDKSKVKKGAWSPSEDIRLISFIQKHGHPNWRSLPKQAGLLRCGKSCRLRWINYLRPDVKRGNFTPQEEDSIIGLHATFGNKWSKIASQLPGRTDNEIKNVWNTHLKKRSSSLLPSSSPANSYINSNISNGILDQQNQNMMMRNDEETCSSSHNHQNPKLGLIDKQDIQAAVDHQASTPTSCNNNGDSGDHEDKMSGEENENKSNNNVVEIVPLLESDEFWNMLDDIELDDQSQPLMITDDDDDENGSQMEVDKWLRLLEEELGLISSASASNSNSC